MSDGDGFNNNLVEYGVSIGLIAKAQSFIIDCVGYLRTQENQRFSASEGYKFAGRFMKF